MISILIPVYNRDCTELLEALLPQGHRLGIPFEIRLYDDGSQGEYKQKHQLFCVGKPELRYQEMPQNLGRSKLRNRLAADARYELLIFMDCDAGIIRSDFLSVYLRQFLDNRAELYVGGTYYSPSKPENPKQRLHWRYGSRREVKSKAFKTFNFAISKTLFLKVGGFDERLTQYGHEDTMFGLAVIQIGEKWTNIDNPLEHLGLENADVFLKKSISAIASLVQISSFESELKKHVGILKLHETLKRYQLAAPLRSIIRPLIPFLEKRLRSGLPNLLYFDIYRLYYLLKYQK